jgi:hypothetical protein
MFEKEIVHVTTQLRVLLGWQATGIGARPASQLHQ